MNFLNFNAEISRLQQQSKTPFIDSQDVAEAINYYYACDFNRCRVEIHFENCGLQRYKSSEGSSGCPCYHFLAKLEKAHRALRSKLPRK